MAVVDTFLGIEIKFDALTDYFAPATGGKYRSIAEARRAIETSIRIEEARRAEAIGSQQAEKSGRAKGDALLPYHDARPITTHNGLTYVSARAVGVADDGRLIVQEGPERAPRRELWNPTSAKAKGRPGQGKDDQGHRQHPWLTLCEGESQAYLQKLAEARRRVVQMAEEATWTTTETNIMTANSVTLGDIVAITGPYRGPVPLESGGIAVEAFGLRTEKSPTTGKWTLDEESSSHYWRIDRNRLPEILAIMMVEAMKKFALPIKLVTSAGAITAQGIQGDTWAAYEKVAACALALAAGGDEASAAMQRPLSEIRTLSYYGRDQDTTGPYITMRCDGAFKDCDAVRAVFEAVAVREQPYLMAKSQERTLLNSAPLMSRMEHDHVADWLRSRAGGER